MLDNYEDRAESLMGFLKSEAEKSFGGTSSISPLTFDEIISGHVKIITQDIVSAYAANLGGMNSSSWVMLPDYGVGPQDSYFVMPGVVPQRHELMSVLIPEAKNPDKERMFLAIREALKSKIGNFIPEIGGLAFLDLDGGFDVCLSAPRGPLEPSTSEWLSSGVLAQWRLHLSLEGISDLDEATAVANNATSLGGFELTPLRLSMLRGRIFDELWPPRHK